MMADILICDLAKLNQENIYMNLGSVFYNFFNEKTRRYMKNPTLLNRLKDHYKDYMIGEN